MNKKILFLISFTLLSAVFFLPQIASAAYVNTAIDNVKAAFITVGSSIIVIGWIITGILFLLASGSPDKIGTAKKALMACVIGTAVIILASVAEVTIRNLLMSGEGNQ